MPRAVFGRTVGSVDTTTLSISDLFDPAALQYELDEGWVTTRRHPDGQLTIFNYTSATQYAQRWNEVTRACRGLIVADDGTVVARPFDKFGHAADHTHDTFDPGRLRVFEKVDGSLGIIYRHPIDHRPAVATRGSFDSDQARWATRWLRATYPDWRPADGWTFLVEIVYPENRIVVDYCDRAELVFLSARHIVSGAEAFSFGGSFDWPGTAAQVFDLRCHPSELPARTDLLPGGEGFIVVDTVTGKRWKVKYDAYIAAHRILYGLSPTAIWEYAAVRELAAAGVSLHDTARACGCSKASIREIWESAASGRDPVIELVLRIPDEFQTSVTRAVAAYVSRVDALELAVRAVAAQRLAAAGLTGPPGNDRERKRLARAVFSSREWPTPAGPVSANHVFAAAINDPRLRRVLWRSTRPQGDVRPTQFAS